MIGIFGSAPDMSVERIVRDDQNYSRRALYETVVRPLENVSQPAAFTF